MLLVSIRVGSLALALSFVLASRPLESEIRPVSGDRPALESVDFLESSPIIDGLLDESLKRLPLRRFPVEEKSSPANPSVEASFRIAYGSEFFYLYLETPGDSFTYRDRAFQYGDGFNLLLALTEEGDVRTDEFYVLAGGAVDRPELDWTRSIFWVYNVDTIFKKTSEATRVEFREHDGRLSFEVLLPWEEVYPYHPWISGGLGFNLRLNKAVGERERNQLSVLDDSISAAGEDKAFLPLSFERPHSASPHAYAVLARNNVTFGDDVQMTLGSFSSEVVSLPLDVELISETGTLLSSVHRNVALEPWVSKRTVSIPGGRSLPPGSYEANWSLGPPIAVSGSTGFSVVESFDRIAAERRISGVAAAVERASHETLLLLSGELEHTLSGLRSYDLASDVPVSMRSFWRLVSAAEEGRDLLAEERGLVRRGFRSKVDGTLQPYSVIVPTDYQPGREYPLVVFLHGSDSTEMDLAKFPFVVPADCIGVGPFARGKTNFYLGEEPQVDIEEAIEAVAAAYSVDRDRIVVAGFSMGGWGALLTYWSNPDSYLGLASFSGVPNVPGLEAPEVPDFRREESLGRFKGADVFVSHGARDNVGSIATIDALVEGLRSAGSRVAYAVDSERGHSLPSSREIAEYHEWLEGVVGDSSETPSVP